MPNFRPADCLTGFLMPPSVDGWLPQTHPARFVMEMVDGLDLIRGKVCVAAQSRRRSGNLV
jgi:hypothetical protein